jgi:tRNA 2-thiouridine synthesizing protein A
MSDFKIKLELDCRQLKCPMPIIKTRKAIETLNSGDVLKMIATDPGSVNDIKAWSGRTGNNLLFENHQQGEFIFIILKK